MASASNDVVQLPPGQPGRLAGPEDVPEASAAAAGGVTRTGRSGCEEKSAPGVQSEAELRRLGLEEARKVLPIEMRMMLASSEECLAQVIEMCLGAPGDELEDQLAESLVDLLWRPLAGCVPQLPGLCEADIRTKACLFWRCTAALCSMPLPQLASMSRRKRPFLQDLDAYLPCADATAAQQRLAHVRLNLPIFAMVAKMPSEVDKPAKEPQAKSLQAGDAVATTRTEDGVVVEELSREPAKQPVLRATPAQPGEVDKSRTAAKHTYDVGYKKWEKFDVDAALREPDQAVLSRAATQRVRFPEGAPPTPPLRPDDPMEMLEGAIEELKVKDSKAVSGIADAKAESSGPGVFTAPTGTGGLDAQASCSTDAPSEPEANVREPAVSEPASASTAPAGAAPTSNSEMAALSTNGGGDGAPAAMVHGGEVLTGCTGAPAQTIQQSCSLDAQYKRWEKFDDSDAVDEQGAGDLVASALREADASAQRAATGAVGSTASSISQPAVAEKAKEQPEALGDSYQRWDRFDAEAALDACDAEEVDRPTDSASERSRAKPQAAMELGRQPAREAAIDAASVAPATANIATAKTGDECTTTGASLSENYKKWDAFDDDMDSVDDDDGGYREAGLGDLDALTGPEEEVARIHEYWRKEHRKKRRAEPPARQEPTCAERHVEPLLPSGPVQPRPCEYRPPSDPSAAAAKAISRDYDKWTKFDADAEILSLDNEGTTTEGDRMRISSGTGSAVLQTENYTKDREEYELDQDIEKQVGGLKKVIAQRVKDAVARKDEGNSLLRAGRAKEACNAYERGLEEMSLCEQAAVLMSDSVCDKNRRLLSDLQRNLAAAQLEVGDFVGARESCTALLKSSGGNDEKALYRRALAWMQLGRRDEAEKDIASLAAMRGDNDAAVLRLRSQACPAAP